ncbi:Pyoverdine/dityrosine biosynthesis protein-domain-containing protein, partial [Blyttiomyces helicus]
MRRYFHVNLFAPANYFDAFFTLLRSPQLHRFTLSSVSLISKLEVLFPSLFIPFTFSSCNSKFDHANYRRVAALPVRSGQVQCREGQPLFVRLFESATPDANVCVGVLQVLSASAADQADLTPEEAFVPSLLAAGAKVPRSLTAYTIVSGADPLAVATTTEALVDVFDKEYRHRPASDQWNIGRPRFAEKVRFYVERNQPLHMVLPAFPCKSSNIEGKTLGNLPDMGEELALQTMHKIGGLIKDIYPPGCVFVIVSDGHVFSDLIGVNDVLVAEYGRVMRRMAADIAADEKLFEFHGLDDLLHIEPRPAFSDEATHFQDYLPNFASVPLVQPLATDRQSSADDARRVMQDQFGTDPADLKIKIRDDMATTNLYRGFSRFLLDDIANHPTLLALPSKNAKKKLCSQLAFEMIQRNNSYSAMVELLFPLHLRISIHPHSNSGPKYGVNLIHSSFLIRPESGNNIGSEALFHIPTPWHNTILESADGKFTLMKHADIKAAVANGADFEAVYYPDGRPSHYKESVKASREHVLDLVLGSDEKISESLSVIGADTTIVPVPAGPHQSPFKRFRSAPLFALAVVVFAIFSDICIYAIVIP